jgi:hypothetical protein
MIPVLPSLCGNPQAFTALPLLVVVAVLVWLQHQLASSSSRGML